LHQAVLQLTQGQAGLRNLFYKLGYDYDAGFLPVPDAVPGAPALKAPPCKVARACAGQLHILWFPMSNLARDEQARLVGLYRRYFPYALYLFSDPACQQWDFVCASGAGRAGSHEVTFRLDVRGLDDVALRTVGGIGITEEDDNAVLVFTRLWNTFERARDSQASRTTPEDAAEAKQDRAWQNAVAWWLRQVGKHPLLTPQEERRIARAVQQGDRAAHERLVLANLRLVVSIARQFQWCGLPLSDLIQEGNIGLIKAVDMYELTRGNRFSTYATYWIRQSIGRAVEKTSRLIRLPAYVIELLGRVHRASAEIEGVTGDPATPAQIAAHLGVPAGKLKALHWLPDATTSLDLGVGEEGTTYLGTLIPADSAGEPLSVLLAKENTAFIESLLGTLSEREQYIVARRFGLEGDDPAVLQDIGDELKISRERVRQIEAQAIRKLKNAFWNARRKGKLGRLTPANETPTNGECGGPEAATPSPAPGQEPTPTCTSVPPSAPTSATWVDGDLFAALEPEDAVDAALGERVMETAAQGTAGDAARTERRSFDDQPAPPVITLPGKESEIRPPAPVSAGAEQPAAPRPDLLATRHVQSTPSPAVGACQVCSNAVALKPTLAGRWYRCAKCGDTRVVPRAEAAA
jgi:RNA polymerase primary sigma factor